VCGVKSERRATALAIATCLFSNVAFGCCGGVLYSRLTCALSFHSELFFHFNIFFRFGSRVPTLLSAVRPAPALGLLVTPQQQSRQSVFVSVRLLRSLLPLYHFRFFVSSASLLFFRLSALLCRLRLSSPPILSKLSALPVGSAHVPRWPDELNGGGVLSVNNPNHQVVICK